MKPANWILLAGLLGWGLSVTEARDDRAQVALQAAIKTETVDGDLKAAIRQYGEIVARHKADRTVAATALVHMAECYRKQGDGEAKRIYERVVREYGDQKEAVAIARAQLGAVAPGKRPSITLIWGGPRVDNTGSVSTDGRYLCFTDWDTGDLLLREISTGGDRRLTNKGAWKDSSDFAMDSVISKDDRQIAYAWYKNTPFRVPLGAELRVASLMGEFHPRPLYDNPDIERIAPFDWSPDGRSLAVNLTRKDRSAQIGLIAVPEGSLRVLKSVDWRGPGRMFFSPDGKHLGYDLPQNNATRQRDVFVLSVDGTRDFHAVAHPSHDTMMGWSPDGKWLLFASDRTGSMALWGLPFVDGPAQGAPQLLKASIPPSAMSMGITRSGALHYSEAVGQRLTKVQIAAFDFLAGRFLSAPTDVTQDYAESSRWPAWAPDGNRLAHVSERGPGAGRINPVLAIRSMDSGQVRELNLKLNNFAPLRWAPDGRSFLTWGTDFKGRRGIHQIDAQTGDVTNLVLDEPEEPTTYPAWALDGKSFFFTRRYNRRRDAAIIRRSLATGEEREVIRRPSLGGAHISPDGTYVATGSADPATNSRTVLLIPLGGGSPRELLRMPSEVAPDGLMNANRGVHHPIVGWAPDSRSLVVWRTRGIMTTDPSGELWQVPIDGSTPRKLDAKLKMSWGGVSVHPDRQRIAYTVSETVPQRNSGIWVLENFLPPTSARK